MATYEEAIKRAMASCPSNVPILQTIQVRHPALPTGDLWFVDRLTPRTLGLEDGSSLSECGLDPGAPGDEPADPGTEPDAPGDEPPEPGNEPILTDYVYVADGISYSQVPFSRFVYVVAGGPINCAIDYDPEDLSGDVSPYCYWKSHYAEWQTDIPSVLLRETAVEKATDMFESDHDWWADLKATHDAWLAAVAAYEAWEAATALHDAWAARDAAYTAWTACIAECDVSADDQRETAERECSRSSGDRVAVYAGRCNHGPGFQNHITRSGGIGHQSLKGRGGGFESFGKRWHDGWLC